MHSWARILGKISEISAIYCRHCQNIGRAFDFLTSNLTPQIRSCFYTTVQILSVFLKASNVYILDPKVDFKFEV